MNCHKCPEVADETNPGKEASLTGRTEVGRGCAVSAGGSFLAYCSLFLGFTGPSLFCCVCVAPLVMSWRQQGLSEARNSQDSVLMLKSFRETFRLSF